MKICFVMYPWDKVEPGKDTTMRIIKECVDRGFEVSYLTKKDISIAKGKVVGNCKKMITTETNDCVEFYHTMKFESSIKDLTEFDIIFMRADPPIDPLLLNMLELIEEKVFFVNKISGLRKANNKIYAASFDDGQETIVPQTLITKDIDLIKSFVEENNFEKFIIKPLDGMGGKGVILFERKNIGNLSSICDFYINHTGYSQPIICQNYIEGAEKGDVRAIVINGEPIGAIMRVPAEGDHRSNISAGGSAIRHEMSEHELDLCRKIGKQLNEDGIYFCGIDLINGKMVELNVVSPGGIVPHNNVNNNNEIQKQIVSMLLEKYKEFKA
ncbi:MULTISPECIES: glutathione synthase [unclassified Empedobacter]|uniref:glutathione synthase n=1 Tax=unclassified Empedobacter TaxID=2643773 RepID=UPI0025C0CB4A|nr:MULTISPECIES: glutathione synthase [unclassified Empedobacter]